MQQLNGCEWVTCMPLPEWMWYCRPGAGLIGETLRMVSDVYVKRLRAFITDMAV